MHWVEVFVYQVVLVQVLQLDQYLIGNLPDVVLRELLLETRDSEQVVSALPDVWLHYIGMG